MQYFVQAPGSPLSPFVETLWFLSDAPPHPRERIMPSGTLELVFNLKEDTFRVYAAETGACRRFTGAMVSGAYETFFGIDTAEHAAILGVHFRPGGAAAFLGVPAGALTGQHVPLTELWGLEALRLRERLLEAADPGERFGLLEAALLERLHCGKAPHRALGAAVAQLGRPGVRVAALAAHLGLSHRRFVEVFTAGVGLSPKRFRRALELAACADAPAWGEVALECGYADQSHLIREFADFAGLSPLALARLRSARVKEHHLLEP